MAASLAATIENTFGLQAEFIEGHNGIYEIVVNDKIVYTNKACEHPPIEEDVLAEISKYKNPLSGPKKSNNPADYAADMPYCAWTPPATP